MTKSKPTHNVVFKAGTYTDGDGNQRNAYRTIGAAWPGEQGEISMIRLETLPVSWDGTLYLRQRDEG